MMYSRDAYWIQAEWGGRPETPAAIADRFLRTIDGLRALDPLLDVWTWGDYYEVWETHGDGGSYPLDEIRPRMAQAVEHNMGNHGRDGPDPDPRCGYMLLSLAEETAPDGRVILSGLAGKPAGGSGSGVTPFTNRMSFKVGPAPDPSLMRYGFWRDVLLLLAEAWEATWTEAAPGDMSEHWDMNRAFRPAWMSYVSPHFAPLVAPPAGVIAERRPNGGLFMAAAGETFRTADPQHLAAARAIATTLQPLNRLDYPIDEPYR